jgi:outer membrane protein
MLASRIVRALSVLGALFLAVAGASAFAHDAGDFFVRARVIDIAPNDDSGAVVIAGSPVGGSGVSVDEGWTLDIDLNYMLSANWGVELLLDLSSRHTVAATGSLASLGEILELRTLPPALLLQYHFNPAGQFQPYAGLGLNYTYFFDIDASDSLKAALGGVSDADLDGSFGLAAQVGADFMLGNGWFLNLDLKHIRIDTQADIASGAGTVTVDVDVNPWVYGIGLGRSF